MNRPKQVGGGEMAGVLDQLTGGVRFAEQIAHHVVAHARPSLTLSRVT